MIQARNRAEPSPRDQRIDTWRAAALARVVLYHTLGWAWLTILFPAMGLMFALAGSLMARSLGRKGPAAVRGRLRRLLPPLWAFALVAVPVMAFGGWNVRPDTPLGRAELLWWVLPVRTPPAGGPSWAWAFTAMLWYLVAYLWFVVLSAPALAAFRRWPWAVLGGALALPVALHFGVFTVGGYLLEPITNVLTYGCCWLLGYAHHDGLLRRIPGRWFAAVVVPLAVASGGWLFAIGAGQGDFDINHVPLANSCWSAAFVAVVLRAELPIGWLSGIGWLRRAVAAVNARAVTIYLWHFSMLIAALHLLGTADRARTPGENAALLAVVVALTATVALLLGWVEDVAARRPPRLVPRLPGSRPFQVQVRAAGPAARDTPQEAARGASQQGSTSVVMR